MKGIRIRLIGNAAFECAMKLSDGFMFDIPLDSAGLPYIPLSEVLPEEIRSLPGLRLGFAHPEGYMSFLKAVGDMMRIRPALRPLIRSCFTEEMYVAEAGYWIRSLRAGLVFLAIADVNRDEAAGAGHGAADEDAFWETLEGMLEKVTEIGLQREGISGEVEMRLFDLQPLSPGPAHIPAATEFDSLEYSILPVTPLCIFAPYAEEARTMTYVPGGDLREAIEKNADPALREALREMTFSNAYISDGANRLLPLPLCITLVKLDKEQLRYRLSSGKDYNRVEQDISPGDAYAARFDRMAITYSKPETEMIVPAGQELDALSQGQIFQGTIRGTDANLRRLYEHLSENPYLYLGHLTQEGYGEVYIRVRRLVEKDIQTETLATAFDVCCLSHTLLYNEEGMQDTTAERFAEEIEALLHARGRLRIAGRFVDIYKDYSRTADGGRAGAETRCLAKGSVLRLETTDGQPIDIMPVRHTFIGERTADGYGEIMAYPAQECYYRTAEQVPPKKYDLDLPLGWKKLHQTADLTERVVRALLKRSVQALGVADRRAAGPENDADRRADGPETYADREVPMELLRLMRDQYGLSITDEVLTLWYQEGLTEDKDAIIS